MEVIVEMENNPSEIRDRIQKAFDAVFMDECPDTIPAVLYYLPENELYSAVFHGVEGVQAHCQRIFNLQLSTHRQCAISILPFFSECGSIIVFIGDGSTIELHELLSCQTVGSA